MRLVIDTNVLVYALLRKGIPGRLIELATENDAVLTCALAAGAHLLVTGDYDLLVLRHFQSIPINTPAQAVRMIEAG